jgi:hypothetical protein
VQYIRLYKPRSADGLLPFTTYQRMARVKNTAGTPGSSPDVWAVRVPWLNGEPGTCLDVTAKVLVPLTYSPLNQYGVLYVLQPVFGTQGGILDGMAVMQALNIANTYHCIVAYMPWSDPWIGSAGIAPWFGTRNDGLWQYDVMTYVGLVGLVDEFYSTLKSRDGRLLLGFSKSGWGALSLLLRNPTIFGYAAAWDASWDLTFYGTNFGQSTAFGTQAQYQLYNPKDILASHLSSVNDKKRIVLGAGCVFDTDYNDFKSLLNSNNIAYSSFFHDLSSFGGNAHNWNSYDNDYSGTNPNGWCMTMIPALMALS